MNDTKTITVRVTRRHIRRAILNQPIKTELVMRVQGKNAQPPKRKARRKKGEKR